MELIIHEDYNTGQCFFYIREKRGSYVHMTGFDGTHLIDTQLSNDGKEVKIQPLLIVPLHMKDTLLKAFMNEGVRKNIVLDNENHLKGKLEATELHLSDMREMTKKMTDYYVAPVGASPIEN